MTQFVTRIFLHTSPDKKTTPQFSPYSVISLKSVCSVLGPLLLENKARWRQKMKICSVDRVKIKTTLFQVQNVTSKADLLTITLRWGGQPKSREVHFNQLLLIVWDVALLAHKTLHKTLVLTSGKFLVLSLTLKKLNNQKKVRAKGKQSNPRTTLCIKKRCLLKLFLASSQY